LPHGDPPDREVLRLHGRRRTHHVLRVDVVGGEGLPSARSGGSGTVSRRVSLPGADELFRPTGPAEAQEEPRRHQGSAKPAPGGSGRVKHDEKMTVYITA